VIDFSTILKNTATLQVHAHWDPIADSTYNLHENSPENTELFDFSPNEPVKEYKGDAFDIFFPSSSVAVGDVWELDLASVIPFLSQFHPGATGDLHHGQKGAFACLRALSEDYADITFRIHAEFTLATRSIPELERRDDEDPVESARFIPSQYTGQLLIDLKTGVICDFSLALPPRNSNVDINDFVGYADMVFVPSMKLHTTATKTRDDLAWENAITPEEARRSLELKFYKFAEIDWLPLEDAVEKAEATQRPIHAVISWGPLENESC